MTRNLSTSLRRRCREGDPMRAYDSLPAPLRAWLAQAALPWSPASCRRIWLKARRDGATEEMILDRLDRAERKTLSRDRLASPAEAIPGRTPRRTAPDGGTGRAMAKPGRNVFSGREQAGGRNDPMMAMTRQPQSGPRPA